MNLLVYAAWPCPCCISMFMLHGQVHVACLSPKGGHPQFKSATPQYCGQPYWLRSWLKKVVELRLRTFKLWLPQFRNFPQSPASPLLSSPVSSAQDGFKNQPKIFLKSRVSLKTRNFPWRDSSTRFLSQIFLSMNQPDSHPKLCRKMWNQSSQIADCRKNCDCRIAELRLRSNMSLKSCGIAIAEELPSSCGIAIADSKKKLRVPTSAS
jgi:hypothetical protein